MAKAATARGSKRRGQILYTVHGDHKTWTFGGPHHLFDYFCFRWENLWYPFNPRKSLAESALVRLEKGYESWTSPSGSCEAKGAQPNGCGTGATILLEIGHGRSVSFERHRLIRICCRVELWGTLIHNIISIIWYMIMHCHLGSRKHRRTGLRLIMRVAMDWD